MNLSEMLALVRRDLKDEVAPYQWSDDELARHVNHAVRELSESLPLPAKALLPTLAGSREVDIAGLTQRVMVQAVEFPTGQHPAQYQRFNLWGDILTILSGNAPDGSSCCVYYGRLHSIDAAGTTLPGKYEELVVAGACAYAALSLAAASINRVNVGGNLTSEELRNWGNEKLATFKEGLLRLGRRQRVRTQQLFAD